MKVTVEPSNISGVVPAPPSKSMTQRAYAAALLHKGRSVLYNTGASIDEMAAFNISYTLGARIMSGRGVWRGRDVNRPIVESSGMPNALSSMLVCNESGLSLRLFTCIAALLPQKITMYGTGTMLKRPLHGLDSVLNKLGVELPGFNGHVPFEFQGPIKPADITIDGGSGSQLLSGVLFALSACADKPVTVTVSDLKSKPYVDLTLEILAHFGKPIAHSEYKEFYIDPAKFTATDTVELNVEGDWSSAAFMLVAGAIGGEMTVDNIDTNSRQADRAILDVLKSAGAEVSTAEDTVTVRHAALKSFEFDATHCPDLFPILSVLAACCNGESYIKGVHRLFHKESNRAESISEMLQNFDVPFSIEEDAFCITGVKKLSGTVIDSFNDHRIAMAAAIGALRARSRVDILNADAVQKSYLGFFADLRKCGVQLQSS